MIERHHADDRIARAALIGAAALLAVCSVAKAKAEDILVRSQTAFSAATERAAPGDRILLADGEWPDFEAVFEAAGTEAAPITLSAQTPGGAVLTGRSNLSITGQHLIVTGLVFRDGYSPTDWVVAFRTDDAKVARDVRFTQNVIEDFSKPVRSEQDSWVVLYGEGNEVDRNAFLGKTNKGPTMIVRLDPDGPPNRHRIEANYFGPRPPLGGNGGETLRIGVSQTSRVASGTVVRGNLFERASGEVEIISIKSEDNLVTENTFYESKGSVVFRHGGRNEVSRNVFLGNGVPDTGGIRVINDRQTVYGNYMEGLRGQKFLGALVVMNGVPNSPENRYHQVDDALVASNSLIDVTQVGLGVGSDEERSATPVRSEVSGNLFVPGADDALAVFDDMSGVLFADNVATDEALSPIAEEVAPELKLMRAENGLLYPEGVTVGAPRDLRVVARDEVGPSFFEKPPLQAPEAERVAVAAEEAALREAVARAAPGAVIEVASGTVALTEPLVIDRPLTLRGADGAVMRAEAGLAVLKAGAALTVENVTLEQASETVPLFVGQGERYRGDYQLALRDVEATAPGLDAAAPLVAGEPESFASLIEAESLNVRAWPGPVFALTGEGLDGNYLTEEVRIVGSRFEDVGGPLIAYGREGRDESTFGPRFVLTDSELRRVGRSGEALVLGGIDGLMLTDNRLRGSGDIVVRRRVLGLPFEASGNRTSRSTTLRATGVEGEPLDLTLTGSADR